MKATDRLRLLLADADDASISKMHQIVMLVRNCMSVDAAYRKVFK